MCGVLDDTIKRGNEKFPGGGGRIYSFQAGDNRIRIVSPMAVYGRHYSPTTKYKTGVGRDDGCQYCVSEDEALRKVTVSHLCWVIDRRDGRIKEADLSYTVVKSINDVTEIDGYGFTQTEDGVFPYDINVRKMDVDGQKVSYNVVPMGATPLSDQEVRRVRELPGLETIVEKRKRHEQGE